jgi:GT2 family glycosyltransferase
MVVPKLLSSDGTVQSSCYHLPGIATTFRLYVLGQEKFATKYVPDTTKPIRVEGAVGAAFVTTREIYTELGGFNEKFFFYWEDLDLCRRMHQAGRQIYYLPDAQVWHLHGASGKSQTYFSFVKESLLYPLKKLFGVWDSTSSQARSLEGSVIYFGYLRHVIITLLIKLFNK